MLSTTKEEKDGYPEKDIMTVPQLKVANLHLNFGGIQALMDVSFEVFDREIFSMIGPNGAGKTCILNCLSGFYKPQEGKMIFEDVD
ncbi:unnamed protein product [marine sediment metagenome]|uniref:ABC transporter domain-containing protein n=1 Tax=marine sediment metagenome TaxID=412755 RepID=X1GRW6_9ZZZZ